MKHSALAFGFLLQENLISFPFLSHKKRPSPKKKKKRESERETPRQDNLLARLCLLLWCYDNYKYMTFIHHDLTVHYGRRALLPSGLRVNFPALFMSL